MHNDGDRRRAEAITVAHCNWCQLLKNSAHSLRNWNDCMMIVLIKATDCPTLLPRSDDSIQDTIMQCFPIPVATFVYILQQLLKFKGVPMCFSLPHAGGQNILYSLTTITHHPRLLSKFLVQVRIKWPKIWAAVFRLPWFGKGSTYPYPLSSHAFGSLDGQHSLHCLWSASLCRSLPPPHPQVRSLWFTDFSHLQLNVFDKFWDRHLCD